ncbi:MAG: 2-octaprenyl-6-methoxyphenyl hydroxylase [bacterium]
MRDYDLIIVGGGLVGSTLALALKQSGLKIALIEAVNRKSSSQPSYDDRTLALSQASIQLLKQLELWDALSPKVTAIKHIIASASKQLVRTHLHAQEQHLDEFGFVVYARDLGQVMLQSLQDCPDIDTICPAKLIDFEQNSDSITIQLDQDEKITQLSCNLLIGADGAQSIVRQKLNLDCREHNYNKTAIITNVSPEKEHHNTAFEHLTQTGPMALLPLSKQRCGLVWVTETHKSEALLGLSDSEFIRQAQKRLNYPLGRFLRCGKRFSYPLHLSHSRKQFRGRAMIMGNAAHTIAPVSAQGFNLGLRDAMTLAELINANPHNDIAHPELLQKYQQLRQTDQDHIVEWTDTLMRAFSNPTMLVRHARAGIMLGLNLSSTARKRITQMAMGF